jgi:hypothetical protein
MAFSDEEFTKVERRTTDFLSGVNYVGRLSHLYYPEITDKAVALEKMKTDYPFWQNIPYEQAKQPIDLQLVSRTELWDVIGPCILFDVDGFQGHLEPGEFDENGPHHQQYARYQQAVNEFIDADPNTEIYLNKGGWVYLDMPIAWDFEAVIISKEQGTLILAGEAAD